MTEQAIRRLRRQALAGAFGPLTSLAKVFARVQFVQADPIRAPARAQDLILRHRVTGYRAGDLERRYPRLGLEEAYLHAYGFMTPAVHGLLLPRYDPAFPDGRHEPAGLAADVLAFVAGRGPTHPAALAERFGREREVNGWGGLSKATTRALAGPAASWAAAGGGAGRRRARLPGRRDQRSLAHRRRAGGAAYAVAGDPARPGAGAEPERGDGADHPAHRRARGSNRRRWRI